MLREVGDTRVAVDLHEAVRRLDVAHDQFEKCRFADTVGYAEVGAQETA